MTMTPSLRRVACFMLAAMLLALAACVNKQEPAAKDTLVVGMELAYPPFEMTDEKGAPTGVSVDLANELGKALGKKIVIQNTAFDGLIPALKTGKIDLIISSMTITDERRQSVDFSDPYLSTGLCLLVGKTSPVNSIADLDKPGITVAVKKGTTGHTYAAGNIKHAKVLVLDKEAAAVLEVVQGKADAFIYDQMSTYSNWKKNQATTRALLNPFQQEKWGIALRKGDDQLKEQINRFLTTFRGQGGFERLGDTWLKEQKTAFKELNYPFFF
ncbi:transporter substrate-binding domain-containing protein [Geobacter sp. AOG2]|uniref:transporter substrate-binding domain-containing protein n=1 Tax=Geobacter sp. AOG2 TaxID=1566347 RepID=UPI001CC5E078|nr:transporter substrate-binding domain-containing protein [Geobacter sp. AOG2]GFE60253.1 amino acid ABC transporter substrate-binding protein [Geobacter sp. AOG2]